MKKYGINMKKAILNQDDTQERIQDFYNEESVAREEQFISEFTYIMDNTPAIALSTCLTALFDKYDRMTA